MYFYDGQDKSDISVAIVDAAESPGYVIKIPFLII